MVNLGLRRSDAYRIGPTISATVTWSISCRKKTARTTGVKLTLPIRPELAVAIAAMTVVCPAPIWCTTRARASRSKAGKVFGAWMREQCDAAGFADVASHGLRKLAAIRLALAGCTVPELCKVFGWSTPAQAQVYVDQADQIRMAEQAMPAGYSQNENVISPNPASKVGANPRKVQQKQ